MVLGMNNQQLGWLNGSTRSAEAWLLLLLYLMTML